MVNTGIEYKWYLLIIIFETGMYTRAVYQNKTCVLVQKNFRVIIKRGLAEKQ